MTTQSSHRLLPPLAILLFCLLAVATSSSVAHASVPNYKAASADGEVVFFETDEQLVPGDTDTKRDVYERSFDSEVGAYVTREVSLGPTGGNDAYAAQFEGASGDGMRVFFSTEERLVAADTDRSSDVYMRDLETGATQLVTQGGSECAPGCGNGTFGATFADANDAGTRVFFETKEKLVAGDTDKASDLYVRDLQAEETELVSVGESACLPGCGNGEFDVSRRGISADGSHAYFTTEESLTPADSDGALDVYARDLETGVTSLVSQGGCGGCGNSGAVPIFDGSSANGSRVFFSTDEHLVGTDTDQATDIYGRDLPNGPTFLVSGGSGEGTASYAAVAADGSHVFFTSAESLLPADTDAANDVYEWNGGALELVTTAPCATLCGVTFDAVSSDSSQVVFNSGAQLSPEDTDSKEDIYRQEVGGGAPALVSRGEVGCPACGNGSADARFSEASADASRVVFTTAEDLLPADGDEEDDIYLRDVGDGTPAGGETSLVTTSPSYCPLTRGHCGATYVGSSADGRHVFFRTVERFTLEDGDNEADVYERFLGNVPGEDMTRLVSTGNSPDLELGPAPPHLTATDPASPGESRTPRVLGEAEMGSSVKIYASADCSGEPVASGSAAQLLAPGLTVAPVPLGSTTGFRATAEAEGFVSSCSAPIFYAQDSEASEGEGPGGSGGGDSGGGASNGGGIFWIVGTTKAPTSTAKPQGPTYVAPHTRITFAPASKTRLRRPSFRFTDSTGQAGTTFRCKLDRKSWKGCSSPLRLERLSRGRHLLEVRAVNGAGTVEATPARRAFKVVPR
jgi:Tol biopolymer transport system component